MLIREIYTRFTTIKKLHPPSRRKYSSILSVQLPSYGIGRQPFQVFQRDLLMVDFNISISNHPHNRGSSALQCPLQVRMYLFSIPLPDMIISLRP